APTGEYNSAITPHCHFTKLEKILREPAEYNSDVAIKIQNWAKECERELSRGRTSAVSTVLRFDSVKYDITKLSIQPLEFEFVDKIKLRALLFLKDNKKRPLVIFKSGIYGDAADGGVLRNFIMHILE